MEAEVAQVDRVDAATWRAQWRTTLTGRPAAEPWTLEGMFGGYERNGVLLDACAESPVLADGVMRAALAVRVALADCVELVGAVRVALGADPGAWQVPAVLPVWKASAARLEPAPVLLTADRWQHAVGSFGSGDSVDPSATAERLSHQQAGQQVLARRVELVAACRALVPDVIVIPRRARQVRNRADRQTEVWLRDAEREVARLSKWWGNQMTKWGNGTRDWSPPPDWNEDDDYVF